MPVLYYLSGLTCTEETFPIKAHAQQAAAQLGIMLVAPDTSPREPRIPGDADSWDFGQGAGFYVDATQAPWSTNYRMYSYVTRELARDGGGRSCRRIAEATGIFGHSMGGHGALVVRAAETRGRTNPSRPSRPSRRRCSVPGARRDSATTSVPIRRRGASTMPASWWRESPSRGSFASIRARRISFWSSSLMPEKFAAAAAKVGPEARAADADGYDHGYYFMQSFMADHLRHHAAALKK